MNLSKYKCEKLEEILKVLLLLSDEEVQAVYYEKAMTQELFDNILDKCTGINVESFFSDFITKHQKFLLNHNIDDEKEMELDLLMENIKQKEDWLDKQLDEFYKWIVDVI